MAIVPSPLSLSLRNLFYDLNKKKYEWEKLFFELKSVNSIF